MIAYMISAGLPNLAKSASVGWHDFKKPGSSG